MFFLFGKGSEPSLVNFVEDSIHLLLHKLSITQIHGITRGGTRLVARLVCPQPRRFLEARSPNGAETALSHVAEKEQPGQHAAKMGRVGDAAGTLKFRKKKTVSLNAQ